jgi:signal transduction histidine kinase
MLSSLPFHKRLFITIYALVAGIVLAFTVYIYHHEKTLRKESLQALLLSYADEISLRIRQRGVDQHAIREFEAYAPDRNMRITLLAKSGDVLYDSETLRPDTLQNHYTRPEVKALDTKPASYAIRYSDSMGKNYFYAAKNFPDYIIRCALPYTSTITFLSVKKGFIWIVLLILLLSTVLLYQLTHKLGKSIALLRDFASRAQGLQAVDAHMLFPENDLGAISKIIVDIYAQLNHANKELSREREKLLEHIQLSNEGIAIFSREKKEILTNKLFVQYAGLISDNVLHSSEEILQTTEFAALAAFIARQQKGKFEDDSRKESHIITKNGKIFKTECVVFQDKSFEIVVSDITKLEEENRVKRQLTQNIAHELKTPVSSIQGYMETIINTPDLSEEKRSQFIARCYSQTVRLTDLLRDISQLNRLDEASQLFEKQDVAIHEVVHNIVHELQTELEQRSIATHVDIDATVKILGNASLVYSIFRNLMDNSISYAGDDVRIHISCYRTDESYYYFSYSDTGVGVSEEHLNRLFERFYRVDNGRSRKQGGTGLGLAIVKNAVLYHKGTISAKNMLTGGLEFLFSLKKN